MSQPNKKGIEHEQAKPSTVHHLAVGLLPGGPPDDEWTHRLAIDPPSGHGDQHCVYRPGHRRRWATGELRRRAGQPLVRNE